MTDGTISEATYAALIALLQRVFPSAKVDRGVVDAVVRGLRASGRPEFASFGGPLTGGLRVAPPSDGSVDRSTLFTTYTLTATHARTTPIQSAFVGEIQTVRVPLGATTTPTIKTQLGVVEASDHLMYSVAAVQEKFGSQLASPVTRVDLITPARCDLVRFSPIAIYLGYAQPDSPTPFFYVLEAGTATGQACVLFLAPTMDALIVQQTGYTPTPFSSPTHWYQGRLVMAPNGADPQQLHIAASVDKGGDPYITLTIDYAVAPPLEWLLPVEELAEAAMRVEAIEKGMGWSLDPIEEMVAAAALLLLPWLTKPAAAAPAVAAASA